MAVQMATYLRGKMDNIIFYNVSGKSFARSMPAQVRQSSATKIRSGNFGIAQRAGAILRSGLQPVIFCPRDKDMQRCFSGAISQWLALDAISSIPAQKALPYTSNFSFNAATSIAARCKVPLTVTQPGDQLLQLHLPAFVPVQVITAPAGTARVQFMIKAAACDMQTFWGNSSEVVTISIPYKSELQPAQVIDLPVTAAAGNLVLTVMCMGFFTAAGIKDQRPAFLPSAVIDARYC